MELLFLSLCFVNISDLVKCPSNFLYELQDTAHLVIIINLECVNVLTKVCIRL